MKKIGSIISSKDLKGDHRNKYEYQAYGNRLAEELSDPKHRSLYIKLAKEEERELLDRAREFALGKEDASTKGRLFMWKLTELRKEKRNEAD